MGRTRSRKRNLASVKSEDQGEDDVDSTAASVKVKHEDDESAAVIVPPDNSTLSSIQKLLQVDLWSDNKIVVEKALCELDDLSINDQAGVHAAGGASALVAVMKKWYLISSIQEVGCRALLHATSGLGNLFCLAAKEVGALEAIVWSMKNYPNKPALQAYGCGALGNLCASVKENAAHVVTALEGLDVIIAAMRKFQSDASVQEWASRAVLNLSRWDDFRAPIVDAGGYRALADALETHKDVEDIQKDARLALKNLL